MNMYAYVANDPVNATDPTGREIRHSSHRLGVGFVHSKVVVVPDNQDKWKNHERFKDNKLPDGRHFATFGAEGIDGKVVSDVNRTRDVKFTENGANSFDAILEHPEVNSGAITEDQLIERMFEQEKNFQDGVLDYDVAPSALPGEGYNSNSWARGFLLAAGFRYTGYVGSAPGYFHPIPAQYFRRATVTIEVIGE
jgi:hypothetical protein